MARFSSADAKEMAARSVASRKAAAARRSALAAFIPPEGVPQTGTDYVARRLARVRVQLDLLDERITEELQGKQPNGQRLNWLAAASGRLEEQEQKLSGRPGPGSRRPGKEPRPAYRPSPLLEVEPPTWPATPSAGEI
jgi:hypothetical protein